MPQLALCHAKPSSNNQSGDLRVLRSKYGWVLVSLQPPLNLQLLLSAFAAPSCPTSLPSNPLQLQIPERIHNPGKGNAQPNSQIPTIISQLPRNGPRPPDLVHAHNRPHPSDQEGDQRCDADG